jgi:hypothetical protein
MTRETRAISPRFSSTCWVGDLVTDASWFSLARLRKMEALLDVLPSRLNPLRLDDLESRRLLFRAIGGTFEELDILLETAASIGLIEIVDGSVGRLPAGTSVKNRRRDGNRAALPQHVLDSGVLARQARLLVDSATLHEKDDCFICPHSVRRDAAQIIEILRLEEQVVTPTGIRLSRQLYDRIGAVWVFMEPSEQLPPWLEERQRVGRLAELFTWHRERTRAADPSKVTWVSLDSDRFGYDVEDRNVSPPRRIEVKGSRSPNVSFFITSNEMDQINNHGENYEIHFWGPIDLAKNRRTLYDALQSAGHPMVIVDPAREFLDRAAWEVRPSQFHVTLLDRGEGAEGA